MAHRTVEMTNLHDKVVNEIKQSLNQRNYDIYLNPGQEKNAGIAGNYPDVIMTIKGTTTVKFILEIETNDSVTKDEAEKQWKKYANEINATFYIVTPESAISKAKQLCQQVGINARFATFSVDGLGNITFKFN
ncbi:MAG: hypothetical protein J6K02_05515 [Alistipes sp.]|jgi:L-rhamnose mutarotase|uniref:hypothetical protein n=1 Tax=Alistipes sp. TaxID=1872444 RepID=UPI001B4182FA|nr:hypothetical protein [Alistipes sp.]MBP3528116.1 hypothetical protein [Alistipes sp.]